MKFNRSPETAILVGATGLVGSAVLKLLLDDISIKKVIAFSRRDLEIQHKKLQTVLTDFEKIDSLGEYFLEAQYLYCCIGTTIRKAGSNMAFRKVDYEIPVKLAEFASLNEVRSFVVVSSLGANPDSGNFYLKTKGEMERDVAVFKFKKLAFIRPSLLLGSRSEFRFLETLSKVFLILFSPLMFGPLKKYRPVESTVVAKAMIQISNSASNQKVYDSSDIDWLGG